MPETSLRELRSFCHFAASYLLRVNASTPVPDADRVQRLIRDLQEMGLRLSDSPRIDNGPPPER